MSSGASGRILQVNVSAGGVPKRPVAEARVGHFGLEGDGHAEPTEHGGPHRAVCLFGIEAIRRVAAEGHPIAPGSCGENLTTEGLELGLLPVGTRLAIGEELVLELSKPVTPCKTIAGSFADGRFARISPQLHPADARMYARVLVEGPVRPGDPIRVLPPLTESEASRHLLLDRIEAAEKSADRERWRAAARLGWPIEIVDDGELAIAASTVLRGPAFNWADGLRTVPQLVDRVVGTFRTVGSAGWLPCSDDAIVALEALSAGGRVVGALGVFGAEPDRVPAPESRLGRQLVVREVRGNEAATVGALITGDRPARFPPLGAARREPEPGPFIVGDRSAGPRLGAILTELPRLPGHLAFLALDDSEPVGAAVLVTRRQVGLVRYLAVTATGERRQAIAAALLRAAADRTTELGGDLVAAIAWLEAARRPQGLGQAGIVDGAGVAGAGFDLLWERRLVRLAGVGTGLEAASEPMDRKRRAHPRGVDPPRDVRTSRGNPA